MKSNIPVNSLCLRCNGISLVDMVVVVTLVGILTVFAIPRFTYLQNDVRASEVVMLGVNLRNAAAAAHAQYVASGSMASSATLKGRVVRLQHGYPNLDGIQLAMVDSSDFTVKTTPTSVTYFKTGAPRAAQCAVTYRSAQPASSLATMTDISTAGC